MPSQYWGFNVSFTQDQLDELKRQYVADNIVTIKKQTGWDPPENGDPAKLFFNESDLLRDVANLNDEAKALRDQLNNFFTEDNIKDLGDIQEKDIFGLAASQTLYATAEKQIEKIKAQIDELKAKRPDRDWETNCLVFY